MGVFARILAPNVYFIQVSLRQYPAPYTAAGDKKGDASILYENISLFINDEDKLYGGETGIRTLGSLAGSTVFETAPFDHSGTSPRGSGEGRLIAFGGGGKGFSVVCRDNLPRL